MSRDQAKTIQGWEYWVERVPRSDEGLATSVVVRAEDPHGLHRYEITFACGGGRSVKAVARSGGADGRGFVPQPVYLGMHRVAAGILGEERGKRNGRGEKIPRDDGGLREAREDGWNVKARPTD